MNYFLQKMVSADLKKNEYYYIFLLEEQNWSIKNLAIRPETNVYWLSDW